MNVLGNALLRRHRSCQIDDLGCFNGVFQLFFFVIWRWGGGGVGKVGHKTSTQNVFAQSFSTTLRVMDVRAENRGRPHQKVRFPAAPVVGRNFLTAGHLGVRVRNVRGKSGPKSLCLCCFFFRERGGWRGVGKGGWRVVGKGSGRVGEGLGKGLERGWGRVGEGVGEGLGKGWGRVGEALAFYTSKLQSKAPFERLH